jgi:hypothetical protein
MVHSHKRKNSEEGRKQKHSHKYEFNYHTMSDVLKKIYVQFVGWVLSIFNLCKTKCVDTCKDVYDKQVDNWTNMKHDDTSESIKNKSTEESCVRFALFDVVESENGLEIKTVSKKCAYKRYCAIWFDLIKSAGFSNVVTGSCFVILYPFITLYLMSFAPLIIWHLIWYQISWWFYTLGLSIILLIVTVPIYLLCFIVSVMFTCTTWVPIIAAVFGIGGLGPTCYNGGRYGCPFIPTQFYWFKCITYFCCVPLSKLLCLKVCNDKCSHNDYDDYYNHKCDSSDCDCDSCDDPCDPKITTTDATTTQISTTDATTTQAPTTQAPTTTQR